MAATTASSPSRPKVAIVGGGITGACAASTLLRHRGSDNIEVDLFDQGRSGPGGRASHRRAAISGNHPAHVVRFDHGCQFFRADTPRFREHVSEWIERGFVKEWDGAFVADDPANLDRGFFGMPQRPPFYVGSDGINSVVQGVLDSCCYHALRVHRGTRVAKMERNPSTGRWSLYGTSGEIAYHDTPEAKVAAAAAISSSDRGQRLGRSSGCEYDVVILTDVSSSFGSWHRASAGVPEDFASKVRERVGARVPLFTALVAFESRLNAPFDAVSFASNDTIWFAARSSSKPGLGGIVEYMVACDCWTIVSTPEYALAKIEETPMQDAKTGAFIPQSPSYLTSIPGPDLEGAFRDALSDPDGSIGQEEGAILQKDAIPKTVYLDAQRWGSALPCHRSLDPESSTRQVISGVPYDGKREPLAPTRVEERIGRGDDDGANFLADDEIGLIQAGDMVSVYTPGFEGAVLSGMDAAEHVLNMLAVNNGKG